MKSPASFDTIVQGLLKIEGGYSNNPADRGGETNFGITSAVARGCGYLGPMKDLDKATALGIYRNIYWLSPRFDKVAEVSTAIASELFDTAVNQGVSRAVSYLNRSLNALVNGEFPFPQDGDHSVSDTRITRLKSFLTKRGDAGEHVMLKALNVLQGARYIELAEARPANKEFIFGWLANRVDMSL